MLSAVETARDSEPIQSESGTGTQAGAAFDIEGAAIARCVVVQVSSEVDKGRKNLVRQPSLQSGSQRRSRGRRHSEQRAGLEFRVCAIVEIGVSWVFGGVPTPVAVAARRGTPSPASRPRMLNTRKVSLFE